MITAEMVKQLRERTGSGMMDCKKALNETNGDMEKAIEYLREKGLATAAKKSGRIAAEGIVDAYIHGDGRIGVLVEVNIETDFAAKNENFKAFVKDIAMQIAAARPEYVRREDVPAEVLEKEKEILKAQALNEGKPEKIVETANRYSLETVQLHGKEPAAHCEFIRSTGLKVIKTFGINDNFNFFNLEPYLSVCEYFLFDTKSERHGGSGLKFNWNILFQYYFEIPFFLSGGITPKDIKTIKSIDHPAFYAVDINSGFEIAAGIKDTDKVKAFINEIKNIRI